MTKATGNLDEAIQKEIKKNMCDKITHLTKVVFMLNFKLEENDAMQASIISSYEKELYTIVKESNTALNQLKAKVKELAHLNDSIINNQLQTIETKYNSALNSYINKYNHFKTEVNNRITSIQQEWNNKHKQMTIDLLSIRNMNDNRIKEMQTKYDEEKKIITDAKAKEVNRLNNEIVSIKNANEKRIELIVNEFKIQIEKYKSETIKLKSEKEIIIQEFNEEISSFKTKIAINESTISIANSQLSNANNEICYFKEKEKEKNEKIKQYEMGINQQNNKIELKIRELNDEIADYKNQLSKYYQLERTLTSKEKLIVQTEKDKQDGFIRERELQDTIETLNKTISSMQKKQSDIEVKYNAINKSNEDYKRELAELNKKLLYNNDNDTKLKIQIEQLKNDVIAKEKELTQQYEKYIYNLKKTANDEKKEYEDKIKLMENDYQININTSNNNIIILKDLIKKYEDDLLLNDKHKKDVIENHQRELNLLKETHFNQLEELQSKLTINSNSILEKTNFQLKALKKAQLDEVSSLESRHREEIDRNTFQNGLNMNELQLKLNSEISLLKIENIQLREKLFEFEKEKHDITINNSKLKRTVSGYPPKKKSELENIISSLRKELLIRENEKEKKKEEFKQKQKELFDKMKKDFNDAMNILQEKNRALINEISELQVLIDNRPSSKQNREGINKSVVDEGSKIDSIHLKRNGSDYSNKRNSYVSSSNKVTSLNRIKHLKIKPISNKSFRKNN